MAVDLQTPQDYIERAVKALKSDPCDMNVPQRRRGVSFREEYRLLKGCRSRGRAPSMLHEPSVDMIPPQSEASKGKVTVILDLDETLIYARNGPLYARPHLDLLFGLLKDHCETVVWTAGIKAYAQCIIKNIDPSGVIEHCIYRHKKWFSGRPGYQKDLKMLGRNMDNVLIVENTPDCVRGNPENGIVVQDYEGDTASIDSTIPRLTKFIAGLIGSGLTVPEYLRTTELAAETTVDTADGGYRVYALKDENAVSQPLAYTPSLNLDLVSTRAAADDSDDWVNPKTTYYNDWINNVAL
eukprot:TRINITY_DN24987_c0_g1_i1.p1 TRINITY_DN24987_c0_g1~~TRINITY_DN24987_c0_g1_i1.p1  ORF type:complete len:311 (+),score=51.30 TRINITY_DN24987_c0_g1_i1:44-934(+)